MTKTLTGTEQKRLHREWRRRTDGRLAVLLDSVQTPFNVGSIIRLAAAFRVEHLWLCGATASPLHPGSRKTSLGTERLVEWSEVANVTDAIAEARGGGFSLVGVELARGATPLHEVALGDAVCLAFGHEERGLSAGCLGACDQLGFIPTPGKVGSLNVASAAGIALFEARRREWSSAPAAD